MVIKNYVREMRAAAWLPGVERDQVLILDASKRI